MDGDGKSDLAIINFYERTVSVLRNTSGSGSISFADKVGYPLRNPPLSISKGDLDGDGKPDLAITYANDLESVFNFVSVLRNTSESGSISFARNS